MHAHRSPLCSFCVALLLFCGLGGCGHDTPLVDLTALSPETSYRFSGPPLPPIHVRLAADRRPLIQYGKRSYLGHSYLTQETLLEPLEVVVLRVLARDLATSGLGPSASIRGSGQPYTLSITLQEGTAHYSEGLENLTIILPTSSVVGVCEYRLVLKDQDGRRLVDEVFSAETETSASVAGGLQETAARTFLMALREANDQALRRIGTIVVR